MTEDIPTGVKLTPFDESFKTDPYAVLATLRTRARTHRDTELGRVFFTGHGQVHDILRDKNLWMDPRKASEGSFSRMFVRDENDEPSMLLMDDPDHRRLRGLVSSSFTPKAVESWRPRVRQVVERTLDSIERVLSHTAEREFDLIADFAGPIPTVVIAEMLGIDPELHGQFKTWSDTSVRVSFNPFAQAEELNDAEVATQALNGFFANEIVRRRAEPGEDLISDMVRAEEAGERLSDAEIVQQCNLLLIAGNVTTTDLIGNGVKALLEHPDQLALLKADPSLMETAVEEMLRFDSPVINSGRIASADGELDGCPIHQGDSLSLSLASATRDPSVYEAPDRFDITRQDTHHHAFGGGRHHCLGAPLARIEAQEAVSGLLSRFENLAIAERGYEYHAIPSFRGLSSFWVRSG